MIRKQMWVHQLRIDVPLPSDIKERKKMNPLQIIISVFLPSRLSPPCCRCLAQRQPVRRKSLQISRNRQRPRPQALRQTTRRTRGSLTRPPSLFKLPSLKTNPGWSDLASRMRPFRPKTGFQLWLEENRKSITDEQPDMDETDVIKEAMGRFRTLSAEERLVGNTDPEGWAWCCFTVSDSVKPRSFPWTSKNFKPLFFPRLHVRLRSRDEKCRNARRTVGLFPSSQLNVALKALCKCTALFLIPVFYRCSSCPKCPSAAQHQWEPSIRVWPWLLAVRAINTPTPVRSLAETWVACDDAEIHISHRRHARSAEMCV